MRDALDNLGTSGARCPVRPEMALHLLQTAGSVYTFSSASASPHHMQILIYISYVIECCSRTNLPAQPQKYPGVEGPGVCTTATVDFESKSSRPPWCKGLGPRTCTTFSTTSSKVVVKNPLHSDTLSHSSHTTPDDEHQVAHQHPNDLLVHVPDANLPACGEPPHWPSPCNHEPSPEGHTPRFLRFCIRIQPQALPCNGSRASAILRSTLSQQLQTRIDWQQRSSALHSENRFTPIASPLCHAFEITSRTLSQESGLWLAVLYPD